MSRAIAPRLVAPPPPPRGSARASAVGQVPGATDDDGAEVVTDKLGAPDVLASICHPLGIDPTGWNMSNVGRPIQVTDCGSVIPGLYADA